MHTALAEQTGRVMVPIEDYFAEIAEHSLAAFCARHPSPFLVDLGTPRQAVERDLAPGMTLDRLVVTPPEKSTSAFLVAELIPMRASESVVTIGQSRTCDVIVDDVSVSKQHAWFAYALGGWSLWDNDSSVGSCVNDQQLERNRPCPLVSSNRITLGTIEFLFVSPEAFYAMAEALRP